MMQRDTMNDRYQRYGLIDWFDRHKLRQARIVVVGAGAVGNEVLKNLTLLGVGHIRIFDFDTIEAHNLPRSVLFRDTDIDRYKADVAAAACRLLDPNVDILPVNVDFWQALTLEQIADSDAVVCCADNYEARTGLNQLCLMARTDFYNTGIDSRYSSVEMFPFATRAASACYECTLPPSVYKAMQKRYSCGRLRKVSYEEKKVPTTPITSSLAGAVVASMLLHRINGHAQAQQDAVRQFHDSISLASTVSVIQRQDNCPGCAAIDPSTVRLTAKRSCTPHAGFPSACAADVEVVLSEPVLLGGTCTRCGRRQDYYASVRQVNDAVTFCTVCQAQSVVTEFVERLSLDEFEATFAGRDVPCKFITCHTGNRQVVVEMEM